MLINFDSLKGLWNGLKVYISDKVKASRGNWSQNNSEADDYIKNRPFYSEEHVGPLDLNFDGSLLGKEYVDAGDGTYLVKLSGVVPTKQELEAGHITILMEGESSTEAIANLEIYEETELAPGATILMVGEYLFVVDKDVSVMGINVSKGIWGICIPDYLYVSNVHLPAVPQEFIKKIDNKFIDAEWIATGGSDNFTTLFSNVVSAFYGTIELLATWTPDMMPLMVTVDGTAYPANFISDSSNDTLYVFGNSGILGSGVNTGEPFLLGLTPGEKQGVLILEDGNGHQVTIQVGAACTPLPEKFLPSSVAKKSDLAAVALSGDYNDLINKPSVATSSLATVATTGSYNDLKNKPNLSTVATTGKYNDLINKPNLATVATTGSYNDLTDKPESIDSKRLILEDVANNIKYNLYIENGDIIISPTIVAIRVASYPSKLSYTNFDDFDISGTLIELVYSDGTSKVTGDYEYSLEFNENNTSSRSVIITYSDKFSTLNTSFEIYLSSLEDFTYEINEDGNYNLTGWKGTNLGIESNECILPSGQNIIL